MPRFSANLGFLWTDLPLPEAVRRAAAAGFDAVEMHFPFATPPAEVAAALKETGLPLLGLNTVPGDPTKKEFGLAALKGREADARAAIDQAVDYAAAVGCQAVHVMTGRHGDRATLLANMAHAVERARAAGVGLLLEPKNHRDIEGYTLPTVESAADIIEALGAPEVRIMFDCYHVQIMQGDLIRRFEAHREMIGHIQVAACPSRREPDEGEIAYERLIPAFYERGYDGFIGAEYRPRGRVEDGLGWMSACR